ncbi:MAG: IclR family transcriptional regulator [Candidatus Humimicrobiaceae bacterium]
MKEKLSKKNQSVEKVFHIIEIMAKGKGSMRLQDISLEAKLPASTVLRLLNTMLTYNYVNQNPETLKYSLSMKFCQIGNLIHSQISIRDIIKPYLIELSKKSQESTCLAIEEDMMAVYIDTMEGSDKMLRTMQRIGKRAPLHSTGVGKLLLLNYNEEELKAFVEKKGLAELTTNTITTMNGLIKELQKVRSLGYAFDNEECEVGARCLAAPIRDYTGKVVASMSVSGPVSRLTLGKADSIKDTILKLSNDASKAMGYSAQ